MYLDFTSFTLTLLSKIQCKQWPSEADQLVNSIHLWEDQPQQEHGWWQNNGEGVFFFSSEREDS